MNDFILTDSGLLVARQPKLIVPSRWNLTDTGLETWWGDLDKDVRNFFEKLLKTKGDLKERFVMMAGSLCNYSSKALQDLLWGKTAYAGETTVFAALYTAAIDDTLLGNTANEAAYTSYARMSLTNNTTNFAAGSGTTTYQKQFPSDAAHSFVTSTGGTSTVTYLGLLNGNAATSADKGLAWCSVTSTTINSGDTPQLAQNAVTVTQD